MDLGAFLKHCRTKEGMSQADLACELNINQSDISKIESGRKEPPTSMFKEWTIATQSADLAVAFLYGAELLINATDVITNVVVNFINFI